MLGLTLLSDARRFCPPLPPVRLPVWLTTVTLFGAGTTAMLHWIGGSYVIRMYAHIHGDRIVIETLNLFAQIRSREVRLVDVRKPDTRPFATFKANGVNYYVSEDPAQHFDTRLLARLLGAI